MKRVDFQDINGTEIGVQLSSNGDFRIYLEHPEEFPTKNDGLGNDIPCALLLSRNQAEILINALQDLFEDE